MSNTNEGAIQYEHSLNHHVEFFSKAGSLYDTDGRNNFYDNGEDILKLFQQAWIVDKKLSFLLLLWLRDPRGGAGNRSGFRKCLKWVANNSPEWIEKNINLIPEYGRWDDLRCLFGTESNDVAVNYWSAALLDKDVLAAKWAKRTDIPLYLRLKDMFAVKNIGDFRRLLSGIRSSKIVETKMCDKKWNEIEYKSVPSVAMARYTNAFNKHDEDRFSEYKKSLKSGNTTINADVLFPYDCKRTADYGDSEIADAQFDALPNYMQDENIMTICDSSGSMTSLVTNTISAYDVSTSLALYCSGKLPKDNPFYKKFIQFCDESKFTNWEGHKFSEAVPSNNFMEEDKFFNGAIGSTRIDKALDLILDTGKMFKVSNDNMPSMLLILSDMQFHQGCKDTNLTEIERSLRKWDDAGYNRPQIVYWNIDPYDGQPDTVDSKDVALVSGFSPTILKSILSCDDFSPKAVMLKTLEKYVDSVFIPVSME